MTNLRVSIEAAIKWLESDATESRAMALDILKRASSDEPSAKPVYAFRCLAMMGQMYDERGEEVNFPNGTKFYLAETPTKQNDGPVYNIDFALGIARLWRVGKTIGGDEDAVRNALLAEVERLRATLSRAELSEEWYCYSSKHINGVKTSGPACHLCGAPRS